MELFSRYGVFNHREMHSRYEIALEQYILSIGVEAALTLEMATTVILPAALRYQTELALNTWRAWRPSARRPTPPPWTRCRAPSRPCGPASPTLRSAIDLDDIDTEEKRGEHAQKGLPAGDGRGPGRGRRARDPGGRRPVAPPHLPGDALHPVARRGPRQPGSRTKPQSPTDQIENVGAWNHKRGRS